MVATVWEGPIDVSDREWPTFFGTAEWAELRDWVDQQVGAYVRGLQRIEYDLIDCPLIRLSGIVKEVRDDGHEYCVVDPETRDLVRFESEHAVRTPTPAWWKPQLTA